MADVTLPGAAPGGGFYFEDIEIGQRATYTRTVSLADIQAFGEVSGDMNPVHFDPDFAARHTPFGGTIAHGLLTASYLSTIVGARFPGPGTIYVNQSLKFHAPVRPGDTVVAAVEVTDRVEKKAFVVLATTCAVAGKTVLSGEATVMVPRRPAR